MNIQITTRDLELMRWINSFGFVTVNHVIKWMRATKPAAYRRLKKLTANDYLIHDRVFHGMPGIYRLSSKGVYVSGSSLPPLKKVPISTYNHDLKVIDLSLELIDRYKGKFIPERQLRHEEGVNKMFGQSGHFSDGILITDNKKIAIELELNKKSLKRRDKIYTQKEDFIKAFFLNEIL